MSKCVLCGNELLTGDIHWQSGMCNQCWNEHYAIKGAVSLDKLYGDLYLDLLKQYRDLEQENKILKEALKLAVKQLYPEPFYKFKEEYCNIFIEQAKENLK